MSKKTSKILKKATKILLEYNWCKDNLCLDKKGNKCQLDDPKLDSIDITGALWLANDLKWPKEAARLCGGLCKDDARYASWADYYLAGWNDEQSYKDKVIQLLDAGYILALQIENEDLDEYFR